MSERVIWKQHEAVVFDGPGARRLRLPSNAYRFVILTLGERPVVIPIDEAGLYEIDVEASSPRMTWPAIVVTVPVHEAEIMSRAGPITELPAGHA